jgi:transposase
MSSYTKRLNGTQWDQLYKYLQEYKDLYIRNEENCRKFVEAVFWMARSGAQWRLLPPEFGHWNTVYRRFADWAKKGVWYKMLYYFANDPDMEYIMVDSSILRAHACASPKKSVRMTRV